MENFSYCNYTNIVFGKDTEQKVGELTRGIGHKTLLHYGGGSIKKSGLYDRVMDSLREAGVEVVELPGAQPNPRLGLVQEGIELCRREGVDSILAVGGGSAVDSAKAIAAGVPYDGDVWGLFLRQGQAHRECSAAGRGADHTGGGQREQPQRGHHQGGRAD